MVLFLFSLSFYLLVGSIVEDMVRKHLEQNLCLFFLLWFVKFGHVH
jgi:hypothetical protein